MSALYDYDGAMRRMGNDEALFQEMIHILREDAPRRFDEIEHGLAVGDFQVVQRAAHSLKGLVANFGGERAQQAALHVEQLAKSKDPAALHGGIAELRVAVGELIAALGPLAGERRVPRMA